MVKGIIIEEVGIRIKMKGYQITRQQNREKGKPSGQ